MHLCYPQDYSYPNAIEMCIFILLKRWIACYPYLDLLKEAARKVRLIHYCHDHAIIQEAWQFKLNSSVCISSLPTPLNSVSIPSLSCIISALSPSANEESVPLVPRRELADNSSQKLQGFMKERGVV